MDRQSMETKSIVNEADKETIVASWFQLVNDDGDPYQGSTADTVEVMLSANVADFRRAVKKAAPNKLKFFDTCTSDLYVFPNRHAFFSRKTGERDDSHLEPDSLVTDFGITIEQALIVLVPSDRREALTRANNVIFRQPTSHEWTEIDYIKKEVMNIGNWKVDEMHDLTYTSQFMKNLGGCTKGKNFWREEEKKIFSFLLEKIAKEEKTILRGSPGVGKSVMITLLVLYLVLVQDEQVLFVRKLEDYKQENCVLLFGFEQATKQSYSLLRDGSDRETINIRTTMLNNHPKGFLTILDGFVYKDLPTGLRTFRCLATSQSVDLKPQFGEHITTVLYPCWERSQVDIIGEKKKS